MTMRRRHLLTELGALACCGAAGPAAAGVADWFTRVSVGQTLPEHDAEYPKGPPPTDARLRLVDFWATWCAPCIEQMPRLNAWHERYAPRGLAIVGLSQEKAAVVTPFLARVPMKYTVGFGGTRPLQAALGIKALPYALFADRRQVVLWRGQPEEIEPALIERLLAQAG